MGREATAGELAGLRALSEGLYLALNRLSGGLPGQLGTLVALRGGVALHHNRLAGGIPGEVGRLRALVETLSAPVGGLVRPAWGTSIYTVFFLVSTILVWNHDFGGESEIRSADADG